MIILFDGFDTSIEFPKWDSYSGNGIVGAPTRFGVGGALTFANSAYQEKILPTNISRLIFGCAQWLQTATTSVTASVGCYLDGATVQATVCIEGDGSVALRLGGPTGTIVSQSAANVMPRDGSTARWRSLGFDTTLHGSTGAFRAWVEGVTVVNDTGLNTISTTNAYANRFRLGCGPSGGNGGFHLWTDDFYLLDTTGSQNNTYPGDVRVYRLAASGAGAQTDLTPSTGSNFQCVDESFPNGDTDYVSGSTAGTKDLYAMSDLPAGLVGTILGVGLNTVARKDDAGTRQIAATVRSNATDQDGATVTLASTYQAFWDSLEKNPDGNVAWTVAAVNALQAGVKVIA